MRRAIFILFCLFSTTLCSGRIITVAPGTAAEFASIQAAINAAANGDTIIVAEGLYSENINIGGKNIVLSSTNPGDVAVTANTVIDGGGNASVVTFSGSEDETCVLSGFTIQNGMAHGGGGGILGQGTKALIEHNVITGNGAEQGGGGGIALCHGMVRNNTISNNWSEADGGGLFGCEASILNNVITGNITDEDGGGLDDCDGPVENNLIMGNIAGDDGGGASGCDGAVQNNTVVGNLAENTGGGLNGCRGMIRNCIVWDNRGVSSGVAQIAESNAPLYCCIQNWSGGGIYTTSNPLFVDELQLDYHLQGGSPCIDTGANYYWSVWPQQDLDGNCRLFGTRPDMGCYEYGSTVDTDGDLLSDSDEVVAHTNPLSEDSDGDGLRDGIEILRHSNPLSPTGPMVVRISGNPAGTVEDIQKALGLAVDGDEIILEPDTYGGNIEFCGADVTLRGINPDSQAAVEATVLDGNGAGPVVVFAGTESESCVLAGLTILGGKTDHGGGIRGGMSFRHTRATILKNIIRNSMCGRGGAGIAWCDGRIEENVIKNNTADNDGGGLSQCHGVIVNNTIVSNAAGDDGGAIAHANGTIRNNTISDNTAVNNGGALHRCIATIVDNSIIDNNAGGDGGGIFRCYGSIVNNTISGNSCDGSGGGLGRCTGVLRNNIITGNNAVRNGGGVYSCDGAILNNLITGNITQEYGGGMRSCVGTIVSNTIVGNKATRAGGGMYDCTGMISNCIVWDNISGPPDSQLIYCSEPKYCCIADWRGGIGNIDADPIFRDPDGPDDVLGTADDDLHLLGGSPCIDAGDPDYTDPLNETDLDGGSRIVGERIDMGAYEYHGCACMGDINNDGWVSPADISALVSTLLPYKNDGYWFELGFEFPCSDMNSDGWLSPPDISAIVNTILPYASNTYWRQCP